MCHSLYVLDPENSVSALRFGLLATQRSGQTLSSGPLHEIVVGSNPICDTTCASTLHMMKFEVNLMTACTGMVGNVAAAHQTGC